MLSVTDTGSGMDSGDTRSDVRAMLGRAQRRKDTGPGLTTVCAIVKALGGGIMVSSELGRRQRRFVS